MNDLNQKAYQVICAAFCVIVVVSNIITAKFISLPFFDGFYFPAGLITYPLTFILSDLTTEIYGSKKARFMVYLALGMALLSYLIIELALLLPYGDIENQRAFEKVLSLNGIVILSSLVAYVLSQIVDIQLYAIIHRFTGNRFLWLRNNGSTLVSQIVDTFTVNIIYLYWGLQMEFSVVVNIMVFSYIYKAFFSIMNTPLFYFLVFIAKSGWKLSPRFQKVLSAERV